MFNPPSSSQMGGSWEKNDSNSQGSYVCYYRGLNLNWFPDVNVVNNPPLTYLSEDHENLETLARNPFLIERNFYNDCSLNDICNKGVCSRKKWRQVQILSDYFGKRWLYDNVNQNRQLRRNKLISMTWFW